MKFRRANRFALLLAVAVAGCAFFSIPPSLAADKGKLKELIKIRIIDSATREPIDGAEVYVRMEGDGGLKRVGVTTNGMAEFAPLNDDRMIEYRVEAKGYRDRTTLVSADKNSLAEIAVDPKDFQLKGIVVGPAGQLVPLAKIAVLIGDHPAALEANARVRAGFVDPFHFTSATKISLGDGTFSTTAPSGPATIIAAHELGCGAMPVNGWTNGTAVQLRPWATVRGRMLINGKPAANRNVVAVFCNFFNSSARMYLRNFEATTDVEGKFVFDRLPAGVIDIAQKADIGGGRSAFSHWSSFVADATLPANDVVYDLVGADIRGTFVNAEPQAPLDWRGMKIVGGLRAKSAAPINEFAPMAGGAPARSPQIFALSIDGDGKFSADAIPPGDYELNVTCMELDRARAQFTGKLVVPPSAGLLDMGAVIVTNIMK
jgi:hypothetical protein